MKSGRSVGNTTSYKTINTGDPETLKDFLRWAQQPISSAEHIVMVMSGMGVGDKRSTVGNIHKNHDYAKLFSICDDDSADDALNPIELRDTLEYLVNDLRDGEPVDVLGFDMASMQFIEIAYQFTGLARVMVASQNDFYDTRWHDGGAGWPYDQLIKLSDERIAQDRPGKPVNAISIGKAFVRAIGEQRGSDVDSGPLVTAIDLNQLDLVTRSIDTLFLALMQGLGDPIIWSIRDRVFTSLRDWKRDRLDTTVRASDHENAGRHKDASNVRPMLAYDLYQMLTTLLRELKKVRTEGHALYEWFSRQLSDSKPSPEAGLKVEQIIKESADELNEEIGEALFTLLPGLKRTENGKLCYQHDDGISSEPVNKFCLSVVNQEAIDFLLTLKRRFLRLDREELKHSAATAIYLAEITEEVTKLLVPPALDESELSTSERLIIAQYPHQADSDVRQENIAPPCGIAIYRPEHLDRIIGSQYLDFEFHRRVHWVPLLAAINLIRQHANSLWRVISSVMATCSGPVRDDLLGRLVGKRSVLHKFGKQFRALQTPPTLTLTIIEKEDTRRSRSIDGDQEDQNSGIAMADAQPTPGAEAGLDDGIIYGLKLESNRQDATVDTGQSFVSRQGIQKTLTRLENIIRGQTDGHEDSDALESFAHDLGEDTLQEIDLTSHLPENGDAIPHLHLQLPLSLMGYPWEVMNDGGGMLCERFAIARQMLVEYGSAKSPKTRTAQKIRVLIIGDPRFDKEVVERTGIQQLPGAREEAREVHSLFTRLQRRLRGTIELRAETDVFIGRRITTHHVRKLLRSGHYDIVHFAGHAHHDEQYPERSSWWLSDGQLWAQQINSTLDRCKSPPWLVYANACESSMATGAPKQYRNNVFGLASAFINEGVTAYLGPLWPINDAVAYQIATDFYTDLLLERKTVGEAIFMAKRNAKQRLEEDSFGAFNDLTWASMIVYGDATMKLLDSLGSDAGSTGETGGSNESGFANDDGFAQPRTGHDYDRQLKRRRRYSSGGRSARPMQESIYKTRSLIGGPGMRARRKTIPPGHDIALELIEINGVRFWQYQHGDDEQEFSALPGSVIKQELEKNERLRDQLGLRGELYDEDYRRVVGRYHIRSDECGSLDEILARHDARQFEREGLVRVHANGRTQKIGRSETRAVRSRIVRRGGRRILLLLHDVMGTTDSVVKSLGHTFARRLHSEYAVVLGCDHWTLKHDPRRNAESVMGALERLVGSGGECLGTDSIDILGIGRGGLVARALVEDQENRAGELTDQVRCVAMIGTPSNGSRLQDASSWGANADLLANSIHLDRTGLYGRLSGLLAHLATLRDVDDHTGVGNGVASSRKVASSLGMDFKGDIDAPPGVRYVSVASSFTPSSVTNVPRILLDAKCDVGSMFAAPHDLLVNLNDSSLSQCASKADGLIIRPDSGSTIGSVPNEVFDALPPVEDVVARGVHHTCLVSTSQVRDFLMKHLVDEA